MSINDVYQAGLRYLTRRDHSEAELARKLRAKGFADESIEAAMAQLRSDGYLNDERFVEIYTRYRLNSGRGPVSIVQELLAKGVSKALISAQIAAFSTQWLAAAKAVREKKFGAAPPASSADKAKQRRFLQYRGFNFEEINRVFADENE